MHDAPMRFDIDSLTAFGAAALREVGAPDHEAQLVAETLVTADCRGVSSHGLMRLPRYVESIEAGGIRPGVDMRWVVERPSAAVLDAGFGFGQVAMDKAVARAAELAKTSGSAVVGVQRSTHFGEGGAWGRRLTAHGCVGIVCSTTGACVAPYGSADAVLGANPLTISAPAALLEGDLTLDMATSATAYGTVLNAYREGRNIPDDWAIDGDGEATSDPKSALRGALRAFGGHKGSGLSFMIELLAGALPDARFSFEVTDIQVDPAAHMGTGHLIIAIDAHLAGQDFPSRSAELARAVKQSRSAAEGPALLPGERELKTDAASRSDGVPLSDAIIAQLKKLALRLGLDLPTSNSATQNG